MKLAATLFSLLPILALGSHEVANRELLTALEEQWYIGLPDPAMDYDPLTGIFTLTVVWGPGDPFIPSINYLVFNICPNGDPEYESAQYQGLTNLPFDILINFGLNLFQAEPDWLTEIDFDIVPTPVWAPSSATALEFRFKMNANIANSDVYTESTVGTVTTGTVNFCLRMDQLDVPPNVGGGQANPLWDTPNFRIVQVEIDYDLTEVGLEVSDFQTQVIEEQLNDLGEVEIGAQFTTGCNGNIEPYNQGVEICIEVCPVDDLNLGVDVASIDSLVIQVDNPSTASNQIQNLVVGGAALGDAIGYTCAVNACCQVRFLADAIFFPVGPTDTPDAVATASGTGSVTMSINNNRRKLKDEKRSLQQETTSNFEGTFEIDQTNLEEDGSSGASTLFNVGALAGAAGAALLL